MCGIAGVVHLDQAPLVPERDGATLRALGGRLAHRGPDDEQIYLWRNVGFAFRRLSIVDLSGGRQPMCSPDGSIVQMTNGEIYNHGELRERFLGGAAPASRSDCAVLIPLYERFGADFPRLLNGIFATAILDQRRRKLLLVRDPLGVKPLYYHLSPRRLVFASELKALLAHPDVPKEYDWPAALTYSRLRASPPREPGLPSFFRGIEHLPGGHLLEVCLDSGAVSRRTYWDPTTIAPDDPGRPAEEYVEEYRALLADSVKLQLMSDVEYGLFLSGGIDSVTVARMASRHASFHTFTVLSQSTLVNGDAPTAHRAARLFELPNHQVYFDWREARVRPEEWKRILWACETHMAGAEHIYKYNLHGFARACRPGLKVMLLGQGSDEFNGGYTKGWSSADPDWQADPSWGSLMKVQRSILRDGMISEAGLQSSYGDLLPTSVSRAVGVAGLVRGDVISSAYLADRAGRALPAHPFHIYRESYRANMQCYQLWHEDRTASAHSIENRVPFLDHRVVEHLYRVPPALYEELFWDKAVLRRAMQKDLPEDLWQREKVPFFYGEDARYTRRLLHRMLRADGDALVEEALAGSARAGGVLDPDALRRVLCEMPDDPEYTGAESVLELVNMGLLTLMATEAPKLESRYEVPVSEVPIDDWAAWQKRTAVGLVSRAGGLSRRSVVGFAPGHLLARCEAGDPAYMDPGAFYVIREGQLLFVIEPTVAGWLSFLLRIDGKRTVGSILEETSQGEAEVWKHLEEAIEHGVLVYTTAAGPAPGQ